MAGLLNIDASLRTTVQMLAEEQWIKDIGIGFGDVTVGQSKGFREFVDRKVQKHLSSKRKGK